MKASNLSHAGATTSLALCYFTGKGVEQDLSKAIPLFQQAAEQGNKQVGLLGERSALATASADARPLPSHLQAEFRLGLCYEEGSGVELNQAKAVTYYVRAAAKNYPEAMVRLGLCYKLGSGVEQDEAKVSLLSHPPFTS